MASAKTATLTFRIVPELKDAVRTAAEQEHRSIANMIEVMIREYCGQAGVPIPGSKAPRLKPERKANPRKREQSTTLKSPGQS